MNRDTIQKLLGGYATGTLTPEEEQALFAAALEDQELFDALAREQPLRDLLRDPAAKAHVLMALDDAPPAPWYRTWYKKRPFVPVLAAAALVEMGLIAVVAVRRQAHHAPAPVIVAELKRAEEKPAAPATSLPDDRDSVRSAEPQSTGSTSLKERQMARKAQTAPRRQPAGIAGGMVGGVPRVELSQPRVENSRVQMLADQPSPLVARKDEAAAAAPAVQQAPAPPAPYVQNQQTPGMFKGTVSTDSNALDSRFGAVNARLLFYAKPPGPSADSVGRLEASSEKALKKKAAPMPMHAASGLMAAKSAALAIAHLGVRCSILRRQPGGEFAEAALETVLDSGEAVRLKLMPNDYGYLFIWEIGPSGVWRQVASGPAEPLKPFETPLAGDSGAGPRQLYVQFTRNGTAGFAGAPPESLLTQARANLTQTVDDVSEQATYAVNPVTDPAAQQLIVPITLNYK